MGLMTYLWLSVAYLFPHGDLHQQIVEISKTITLHPDSTQLYLERGELYLQHEEADEARSDFSTCIRSGLSTSRVYLGLSTCLLSLDLPDSALYYVDLALEADVNHPSALECKASALNRLSMYCESAEIYLHLIALAQHPSPSLFIDASLASRNCPEADGTGRASKILLTGMDRIGRLHVLEKELVRVYLQDKRYTEALQAQTEIIHHWPVKTKPYYERAEIYLLIGEKASAMEDLHNALLSIDRLPGYKSSTPAMKEMRSRIVSLLNQTGS